KASHLIWSPGSPARHACGAFVLHLLPHSYRSLAIADEERSTRPRPPRAPRLHESSVNASGASRLLVAGQSRSPGHDTGAHDSLGSAGLYGSLSAHDGDDLLDAAHVWVARGLQDL